MWKQKLCLGLMGGPGNSVPEQIAELKEVGYDAFFTGWRAGARSRTGQKPPKNLK